MGNIGNKNMGSSLDNLSFLSAMDADYVSALYAKYLDNAGSVDNSWSTFFTDMDEESREVLAELHGASWTPTKKKIDAVMPVTDTTNPNDQKKQKKASGKGLSDKDLRAATQNSVQALMMIRAYRVRGHFLANLDPLGLAKKRQHPELDPKTYGFDGNNMDTPIFINGVLGLDTATPREIISALKDIYCREIGIEFTHIQNPEEKAWLQERIEGELNETEFSPEGKKAILTRLTAAEGFENFLNVKYPGTKRFGLDGGEALVPAIEQIMKRGGQLGVKEIVIGMAHRGRLNVLTNVMHKSFTAVFSEFQGGSFKPEDVQGSGDVKYHLGTSSDRDFDGNNIHLSLTANPSHLEVVDPVVIGKARAKQDQLKDSEREQVIGLLLHGDAAVAGQGVVPETLMMSGLEGYTIGGTMHIVINNQIGFTTAPDCSRSGHYATDVAKMIQVPIFHVNGDAPESVVHVARIATEYRQKFKKDVFIDLLCYRRFGHNEGDEPAFTQPLMYKAIKKKTPVRKIYAERLIREGVLDENGVKQIATNLNEYLEKEFKAAENYKPNKADMLKGHWDGLEVAQGEARRGDTSISEELVQKVGKALSTVPSEFNINPKIARQIKAKEEMFKSGQGIDWATAEALAFGTLAAEGYPVRLSGQDCKRGTFSQRHSVLIDQMSEEEYTPLNNIIKDQASFEVLNSPLSEMGVLGFEYGYSLAEPNALTLWEAQFGDFVNGAQMIIDQFISSGESKWLRMSGLVMLLPHGYEGQGPEHSSARMERFLQSCGDDNWQIVNCTTPANYFHVLRRQMHREFRKPLIIFTPKSLLRHKACVSPLSMMTDGQTFHRVLYEDKPVNKPKNIKRVVLCSGKVYYDLIDERDKRGIKDITIMRLEQLYPFPYDALKEELTPFVNADVVWCQEESENMGAWTFVDRRIEKTLSELKMEVSRPAYAGRKISASPATGQMSKHLAEQAELVDKALTL